MASVAFPAWCLGHNPSAQILCVSYAQDLADKLARDCRSIMMRPWYRRLFPTRLAPHRHAVQEFITTRQGYRLATLDRRGTDRTRSRNLTPAFLRLSRPPRRVKVDSIMGYFGLPVDEILQPEFSPSGRFCVGYSA